MIERASLPFNVDGIGFDLADLIRDAEISNSSVSIEKLNIRMGVFDELISIYVSLHLLLMAAVKQKFEADGAESPELNQLRSSFILASRIVSDGLAIRRLVHSGFDVQARSLLRSMDECCEMFAAFQIDHGLAVKFFESQELEQSRQFWHKYTAKGIGRKLIDEQLSTVGATAEILTSVDQYRREERLVLMAAKHSSYISGYMAFAPSDRQDVGEGGIGLFGNKSKLSVRTLTYSISVLLEPLIVFSSRSFHLLKLWKELFDDSTSQNMLAHVDHGPSVILEYLEESKFFRDTSGDSP